MDFHGDAPGQWARLEVGDMLQDFGAHDVARLPDDFEPTSATHDGGPEMAPDLLAELARRAAAGMLDWPELHPVETPVVWGPHGPLTLSAVESASLEDDGIPW